MRLIFFLFSALYGTSGFCQLVVLNPSELAFDYEDEAKTRLVVAVFNESDDLISFDWKLEIEDIYKAFIETNVSDINIDYNPNVFSNCGLNVPNMIAGKDSAMIYLNINVLNIPDGLEDKIPDINLFLLNHPDCLDTLVEIKLIEDSPTASSDLVVESLIDIYPNPAQRILHFNNFRENNFSNYTILDLSGRVLQSDNLIQPWILIDELKEGLYHIQLSNKDREVVKKFFKVGL